MEDHDGMSKSGSSSISNIAWKEWLMKAGLTGAVAAGASIVLFPTVDIDIAGVKVPSFIGLGLGAAGGSLAASAAHEFVFPMIPHDLKWDAAESTALSIGSSGAGTLVVSSMVAQADPLVTFAVGAASFAAADYAYSKLW